MTQTVTMSKTTYEKLQQLAKPFVDTPESVIARLADDELKRRAAGVDVASTPSSGEIRLDPDRHDSLTHSRLLSAKVNGKDLHRPKWNNLLDELHVLGKERLGSFDALKKVSGARLRSGRFEEEGFHYLPEAGLSIQGLDSNSAWDHALKLARELRVGIAVRFEWRDKPGSARPGETGSMEWAPPSLAVA